MIYGTASVDNRFTVLANQNTAEIWEGQTLRATIPHELSVRGICMSRDGSRFMSIYGESNVARVWSIPDGKPLNEPLRADPGVIFFGATFSADGRLVAVLQSNGVRLVDVMTGQPFGPFFAQDSIANNPFVWPRFTPDGTRLVTVGMDRTAKVWDVASGQLALPPLAHGGVVRRMSLVGGGRFLYTNAGDGFCRLWDLATGQLVVEPIKESEGGRLTVAPDGRHFAQVMADGGFRRFAVDPNSARPLALPRGETGLGSAWLPDRPAIMRRVTKTRLSDIDVATGREIGGVDFPEPIIGYNPSANGNVMVVTTSTGARQTWALTSGGVRATALEQFPPGASVFIRLSNDGVTATVIASPGDTGMRVWNLRTGQPNPGVMTYANRLRSPAFQGNRSGGFSPDGQRVAAGAFSGRAIHPDEMPG